MISRFDFGGAENYVRELANQQALQGNHVYIISKQGRQMSLLHPLITYLPVKRYQQWFLFKIPLLIFYSKKIKFDIIHAHQRQAIFTTSVAGYITKIPVVVTIHGRVRHDLPTRISRTRPSRFIFVSQQVLSVSKFAKKIKSKSIVIPNGVHLPATLPSRIPFHIGYLSRIDSRHSLVLEQLIKILPELKNQFPELQLTVFGEGSGLTSLKKTATEINSLLGSETIHFHGYIENFSELEQVPELFLAVGRVAIEACAHGISVISVNQKRMGSIIEPDNFEFYKTNNFVNIFGGPPTESCLYETISRFLQNRNNYSLTSTQMVSIFQYEFSWEKIGAQITGEYQKL